MRSNDSTRCNRALIKRKLNTRITVELFISNFSQSTETAIYSRDSNDILEEFSSSDAISSVVDEDRHLEVSSMNYS